MSAVGPETPAADVDFFDLRLFASGPPYDVWRTFRRESPIRPERAPSGARFFSVFRYDDCAAVLKNTSAFSSAHGTILASLGQGDAAGGRAITVSDPPRHTHLKARSMRAVSARAISAHETGMRERIRRLLEPCFLGGEHDFAPIARSVPLAIAGPLIGLDESLWDEVAIWTMASLVPDDETWGHGQSEHAMRESHHQFFACLIDTIRSRRRRPQDDLISGLVTLEIDGERLSDSDVLLNCYSIVGGAVSMTTQLAANTVRTLAERPDLWQRLADGTATPAGVVDETARWRSTVNHTVRRVLSPVEIGGLPVDAGDYVCLWLGSANRDELAFDRAEEFDPDRTPNPHLTFGLGPHYCIGASASRAGLTALAEELVRGLESIEIARPPLVLRSNWINGVTSLPIICCPRGAR